DWVEDAGLLVVHVPVPDMEAPTPEQLARCVSAIRKANEAGMGVAVHCTAGLGRTGSILAAYLVSKGLSAEEAMTQVRELRPGSIETEAQEEAIQAYARKRESEIQS
ncbi:MAG TPA: dual specificity protein phosphatase family protein, partial [Gemmataceae bacterium]